RMEGDDRKPAARAKHTLRRIKPFVEFVELAIEVDADGLEGAGGWVLLVAGAVAKRLAYHRSQLARARDRASGDDRLRNPARARLLAQSVEDVGNLFLISVIDEVRRRHAGLRHAHVERAVSLKREATIGAIELHRRDADIEHDPVDRIDA